MIRIEDIRNFYFLGIGGIGMSALARYFHHRGYRVAGYDRTPSPLTKELETEGLEISYTDAVESLQSLGFSRETTLIVRTPAVPADSAIYTYLRAKFRNMGYASALAWFLFVIVLILTLLTFKSSELWVFYESEVKR